jgi:hypothetical protein
LRPNVKVSFLRRVERLFGPALGHWVKELRFTKAMTCEEAKEVLERLWEPPNAVMEQFFKVLTVLLQQRSRPGELFRIVFQASALTQQIRFWDDYTWGCG